MIVAIHQPNYLPWLGYFAKLASCDCFVLLDNVQFPRLSYCNRVQVRDAKAARWLSVPMRRSATLFQPIRLAEIQTTAGRSWADDHLAKLGSYYRRTPFYAEAMEWTRVILNRPWTRIAELNECIVRDLSLRLGLCKDIRVASSLPAKGSKTELIRQIVESVGGNEYVRGQGAVDYQDDRLLLDAGIKPLALKFDHPTYRQTGSDFIAGLSVLDALLNCGFEGTAELVRRSWSLLSARQCGPREVT